MVDILNPSREEVINMWAADATNRKVFIKKVPTEELLEGVSDEEKLKGIPFKKRLEGVPVTDRLEGLTAEQIQELVKLASLKVAENTPTSEIENLGDNE